MKVTVKLLAVLTIILALCLGFTGRVDWWVVALISLSQLSIDIELHV